MIIAPKEKCTGCELCVNVCAQKAIQMREDQYGFLYPEVDNSRCVQCGLCSKKCPANLVNQFRVNDIEPKAYAVINHNKKKYMQGSSGGFFSALAEWCVSQNGVVFGAAWDDALNVAHIGVEDGNKLLQLYKSKYVQSRINHVYKEVRDKLIEGKIVLFSGTPCQVAALKSYLGKKYDKLYCVDVVCHGVPNNKIFHSYLDYIERLKHKKIEKYEFRGKVELLGNYNSIVYLKKSIRIVPWQCDPYVYLFMHGYINRESCFSCKYACKNRVGDITLSDYWGYKERHASFDVRCGISLVLVNTEKGSQLFEHVQDAVQCEETDLQYAIEQNAQLKQPTIRPAERNKLLEGWRKQGFSYLYQEFLNRSDRRYKYWLKVLLVKSYSNILHKRLFPRSE